MFDSLKAAIKEPSTLNRVTKTIKLIFTSLLLMLAVNFIFIPHSFLHTSPFETVKGFEKNTLYTLFNPAKRRIRQLLPYVCSGDVIKFRSRANRRKFFRVVTGSEGNTFKLTENGYQINGKRTDKSSTWLEQAKSEWEVNPVFKPIGENEFLVVNTEFGKDLKYNDWAYEIVRFSDIKFVAENIIFSRDFSKIGERVKVDDCWKL